MENNNFNLIEKIRKEKASIADLKQKRSAIEEKIKKKEKILQDLENIRFQKDFEETRDVIIAKGLTVEEVFNAIKTNKLNLSMLQKNTSVEN